MTRRWETNEYGRTFLRGAKGVRCQVAPIRGADAEQAAQYQLTIDAILAVKPHRDRRARAESLERAGARVLERARREPPKRPWTVRVYFTASDDTAAYAEFSGLTEPEAMSLRSEWRDAEAWAVTKRPRDTRCRGLSEDDALAKCYPQNVGTCAAATWCACRGHGWIETPPPAPRAGARKVVFPSERPEAVERSEGPECGARDTGMDTQRHTTHRVDEPRQTE